MANNNNDISAAAEKYRQEMMRLYNRSSTPIQPRQNDTIMRNSVSTDENVSVQPSPIELVPDNMANMAVEEPEPAIQPSEELDERYPDPDISDLDENEIAGNSEDENIAPKTENAPIFDDVGRIQVNVRTADSAEPVTEASVIITSEINGNKVFEASAITDDSGSTPIFSLPAPNVEYSLEKDNKMKPYSSYTINVLADGFFRSRSENVPVFAGITSVQQFNMVPMPAFMSEGDEVITYYNQEPDL